MACLCTVFFLVACGKNQESGPIKIAVVGPQTGDLASYGIPTVKAVGLVVDRINASGGIHGKPIKLIIEDDVCKPEIAANISAKVVGEGVHAVIGHICSGATKAALGVYKDARIVVISPSATNPDLTQSGDYPNFFRTIASDDTQAKLEVAFAANTLQLKKIAVLHDKGDYGKGLAEFAKKFIEGRDDTELVLYEGITPNALDYSAVVQKIRQSGADGVIYGGYHPEASKIVSQMRKKNMTARFISDDGVKDDTFIKVAGEYAEGVYATGPRDTSTNPLTIGAQKELKEKHGEDPGAFFLNAYAATLALLNAIEKSNSTNEKDIAAALRNETVDTPLGKIRFDERGDAIGVGFTMYQVKKGKYVQIQ